MAEDAARIHFGEGALARYRRANEKGGAGGLADDALPVVRVLVAIGSAQPGLSTSRPGGGRTSVPGGGLAGGLISGGDPTRMRSFAQLATPRMPVGSLAAVTSAGVADCGDGEIAGSPIMRIASLALGDGFIVPGADMGKPGKEAVEIRVVGGIGFDETGWKCEVSL